MATPPPRKDAYTRFIVNLHKVRESSDTSQLYNVIIQLNLKHQLSVQLLTTFTKVFQFAALTG